MINSLKSKKIYLKYTTIVIFCAMLDIVIHAFASQYTTLVPGGWSESILVKTFGFQAVVIFWALMAFGCAAYLFSRFQDLIPGRPQTKGILYGAVISMMWFWGNIENHTISGTALTHEIIMAFSDGLPMLLMGFLLGKFAVKQDSKEQKKNHSFREHNIILSVLLLTTIYTSLRYLFYVSGMISSGYQVRPAATFIWTLLMGLIIGMMYLSMFPLAQKDSPLKGAFRFGILFGGPWMTFSIMIPLAFHGLLVDILFRCSVDIIGVMISCYIANRLSSYRKAMTEDISG